MTVCARWQDDDDLKHPLTPLASDLVVQRPTEWQAQVNLTRVAALARSLKWRQRQRVYFTEREVEAVTLERWALSPTAHGPQRIPSGVAKYIAGQMHITERRVHQLLKRAEQLMTWLVYADEEYAGWVNAGTARKPVWRLQVPTQRQQVAALRLVERVIELEQAA